MKSRHDLSHDESDPRQICVFYNTQEILERFHGQSLEGVELDLGGSNQEAACFAQGRQETEKLSGTHEWANVDLV